MHRTNAMPGAPLKNPRWEKFCQAYARGETGGNGAASYRAAGYQVGPRSARRGAFDMLKRPEVRARIDHLQAAFAKLEEDAMARAAERLALTKEAVLLQQARIGFANIADYIRTTGDGRIVVDLAGVDRDRMAGIVELQVTERGEGAARVTTTRVKLGERLGALTNLGKHFGLFNERIVDHDPVRDLTDDQLKQRIAELQRKLGYAEPVRPEPAVAGVLPPRGEDEA